MDRQLKERLVGALVLVALAIIIIPTVLDGPDQRSQTQALDLPSAEGADAAGDAPVESYHFELDGPTGTSETGGSEPATPQQQQQAIIDASPVITQTEQDSASASRDAAKPPVEPNITESRVPAPADTESEPVQNLQDNTPAETAQGAWAVQVGSFSQQALARSLAADLEKQGYRVFLMTFSTGGVTYHRVRVGPFTSKEKAGQIAQALKQKTGGPAKVVSN